MDRKNDLVGGKNRQSFHKTTRNGEGLSDIPYGLNDTYLSWEEVQDSLCLRYGMMPQDIPATCDDCGKRFSIDHPLS